MKNNKLMVNVLFLALLGIACFFGCYNSPSTRSEDSFTEPDLEISAGEITIVTPENKTYTQPDDGYYPGTYGFENDESNSFPKGWVNINEPYAYTKVVDGIDGHNKVLECYSGSETESYLGIKNYFEPQVDGTVEFWLRKSSTESSLIKFSIYGTTQEGLVSLQIDDKNDPNKIKYSDGVQWVDTGYAYSDDTWIHIRIDLDCTTDKYTLWIDEMSYLDNYDFAGSSNEISFNQSYIWSWDGAHPTLCWFDAIGYSWDPNYNIGDNLKEGLLLGYDTTTPLQWQGYSLDEQENVTIYGNYTIPMPSNGVHYVQMFGNDSLSTMYESNVRYFTVGSSPYIEIVTPENKIYNGPDSGYYPSSFGFENDLNGVIPFNWVDTSTAPCYAKVIDGIGGHNKVMEVYGRGQTSSDYAHITNYFQNQTSGILEWWWRKSSTLSSCAKFDVLEDGKELIDLRMDWYADPGKIEYEENGWLNTGYADYADDKWIHMKLSFDCTSDVYSLTIDGVLYLNNIPFHNGDTATYINNIRFYTYAAANPTLYFVDAVGYSWDPNYDLGDNLNEGLLLSYDNTTTLDWQGYSLDEQDTVTILGNTTITMPSDGLHNIQVFGNNTLGTNYASNLRWFTVDTNPLSEDDWLYFRELSLNPSTPENNFQVKVLLNDSNFEYANANSDGSDLRFYDPNNQKLSYWIESWVYGGESIIWVNVPVSGTSSIYMYYGNSQALSESNGEDVFIFFDDFEGSNLNLTKWNTDDDQYSSITVSNSQVRLYTRPPSVFYERTHYGFHDYYIEHGETYGYHAITGGAIFTPSENNWLIGQMHWINSTSAPYYENDVLYSDDTDNPSGPLPVRFYAHTAYAGPGTHWGSIISSNDESIGIPGRSMRVRTWLDETNEVDIRIDWVAVHKWSSSLPEVSIGEEMPNQIAPIISVTNPTPNEVFGMSAPDFELSIFGTSINTTWYTIDDGSTNITFSGLTGAIDQTEWDKKGDGDIILRFYVNNTLGNSSYTDVIIKKDTLLPLITIDSPLENEVFGKLAPNFNLTITEPNIDLMWYTLDYGVTNITHALFDGTINQAEWNKKGNGTVDIRFYVLDKAGNEAYEDIIVRKEISDPIIIISDPLENDVFGYTAPFFNVTVIEPDFDSLWYTLDDGINNVTAADFTGDISQTEWDKKGSGIIIIKFYADDTLGNNGYAEVSVEKDITDPIIQVNIPTDSDIIGYNAPSYDVSITDPNLDSMWYTLDNGITNIPIFSFTGDIDQTEWDKKGSGTVSIRFYANDTIGNTDYTEVLVTKDLIDPIVSIITPNENEVFGTGAPTFEISVTELNLDMMWYTLDNGLTNIPFSSLTGTIDQTEWNKKGTEDVIIKFYARDEAGNEDYTQIIVIKDIDIPIITIISPEMDGFANFKAPSFDLSVQEPNIDSMWYTFDYGMTNYFFTEFTGLIDQNEWNKYGNGSVVIQFYVRDEGGNEAFSEVRLNKDIYAPIITITTPEFGEQIFDYAPIFSISIQEPNLDSFWYSLDNGNTNFTITELTGVIDLVEWKTFPDGPITIRFYAKDKAGNVGVASVIVTKITTNEELPPGIPGYDLCLAIGIISIVSILIIRKRLKS